MGIFLLILVLLAVVGGLALAFATGALAVGRNAEKSLELVPGTDSKVPDNWFGSHEPEAKLFRRLQEAVSSIHAMGEANPAGIETVVSIDHQALRLEEQLIAASQAADRLKPDILAQLEDTVAQIEEISAAVIGRDTGMLGSGVKKDLDDLAERLELIDQARAELDQAEPGQNRPDPGTS